MQKRKVTLASELEQIRKKLGHYSTAWKPREYLNTGSSGLNAVLGCEAIGIPYGKLMELSGPESNGKTALAIDLAAMGQRDGAGVTWLDPEMSWDETWALRRGLNPKKVQLIQPYVGTFGKDKLERLITAEELCEEAELAVSLRAKRYDKQIMVVDSVTAFLTEGEAGAGLSGQNLRTNMGLPQFMGHLLRRWVGLAQSSNLLIIFINQLRVSPGVMFGNPEYTPGGKALKFYCHIRASVRRVKGGRMLKEKKVIGIKGIISNMKNKVGGVEGTRCGYKILFKGSAAYMNADKLKKEDKGEVGEL